MDIKNTEKKTVKATFAIEHERMKQLSRKQRTELILKCENIIGLRIKQRKEKERGNLYLDITADPDKVQRAREFILQSFIDADHISIPDAIPDFAVDCLFFTLKQIELENECKIIIPKEKREVLVLSFVRCDAIVEKIKRAIELESMIQFESFSVPVSSVAWIKGPRGKTINHIKEESGATHIAADFERSVIMLRGSEESRVKAKKMIMDICSEVISIIAVGLTITPCQKSYLIDNAYTGDNLMDATGVYLDVHSRKQASNEIYLLGKTREAIEKATLIINRALTECLEEQVGVPEEYVDFFFEKISHECRKWKSIKVEHSDFPCKVALKGPKAELRDAKRKILSFVKSWTPRLTKSIIPLDPGLKHMILNGNNQLIPNSIPCSDFISSYNESKAELYLIGPKSDMPRLILDIKLKTSKGNHRFEEKLLVDPKFHRYIIGQQGCNINALRTQFKVNISVPPRDAKTKKEEIVVSGGSIMSVQKCVQQIKLNIQNIESSHVVEQIMIPKAFHGFIVGPRGYKRSEIMRVAKVELLIPEQAKQDATIHIKGLRDGIEIAKKLIDEVVVNLCQKDVKVPERCLVETQNGTKLKTVYLQRCPRSVKVEKTAERNTFFVSGPISDVSTFERQVEAERNRAEKRVQQTPRNGEGQTDSRNNGNLIFFQRNPLRRKVADAFRTDVVINPLSIPRLIGKGGCTIQAFQHEYNVVVKFNAYDERPELVRISGRTDELVTKAAKSLVTLSSTRASGPNYYSKQKNKSENQNLEPMTDLSAAIQFPPLR